jgi:hypothetical protein
MLSPRQIFEDNIRPADLKQQAAASHPQGTA